MSTYTKSTGYKILAFQGTATGTPSTIYTPATGKFAWLVYAKVASGQCNIKRSTLQPGSGTSDETLNVVGTGNNELEYVDPFSQVADDFGVGGPFNQTDRRSRLIAPGENVKVDSAGSSPYLILIMEFSPQV